MLITQSDFPLKVAGDQSRSDYEIGACLKTVLLSDILAVKKQMVLVCGWFRILNCAVKCFIPKTPAQSVPFCIIAG